MLTLFTATLLLVGATAIGVRNESSAIVVESGAGLNVTFDSNNCDITSLKYKGVEYQSQLAYSHLASGLGSDATVEYDLVGMFSGDNVRLTSAKALPSDFPRGSRCGLMLNL